MNWKLGEIRKVDGEWYQCVRSITCNGCGFNNNGCTADRHITGDCSGRLDGVSVIFKKLTKYMHPFCMDGHRFQLYLLPEPVTTLPSESEEIKLVRWDIVQIMETI